MPKFIMLLHDSGTFPPDISPDARLAAFPISPRRGSISWPGAAHSVVPACHPALPADARVALALKRPGHRLRHAGADELAPRLDSVLEALYLIFNEGYAATSGDSLVRDDVAGEAIRLASLVAAHPATGSPKAWALLALMLLHAARCPARVDSEGTLFLLRDQDRVNGTARRSRPASAHSTGRPPASA